MDKEIYDKAVKLQDKIHFIKVELKAMEKMKSADIIKICNNSPGDDTTAFITDEVCFPGFMEHIFAECKQMLQDELEATIKEFDKL